MFNKPEIECTPLCETIWEWMVHYSSTVLTPSECEWLLDSVGRVADSVQQIAPNDEEMLIAALLYSLQQHLGIDLPEELPEDLFEQLGEAVLQLIEGTVEMTTLHANQASVDLVSDLHHENLRKMLLAMAKDVRVVVIKLATHLELMRTPGSLSEDEQIQNAQLTRNILAPLANRLGMGALKWQLEDLAFRVLDAEAYQSLSQQIELTRRERELYVEQAVTAIRNILAEQSITGEVSGRSKHLYSIWKKMVRKRVEVESLYDLNAVRILVETVSDCYAALGVVHGLWNHIPKEFDDYIANPKGNNYRSIHTAVFGPEGRVLEVQIRTHEMHDAAELGVASHWRYKEGTRYDPGFERKVEWLRQLLEWKDEVVDQESLDVAQSLGTRFEDEMAQEHIYVLTPAGEVIELPEGGTALDFAYTIHSGLGHRTRGAKVDGRIVPLNQPLQSGQRIEILTIKEGGPTRDWMNPNLGYLATSRARSRIRQWFRKQDFEENIAAGRTILERERVRAGSPAVDLEKLVTRYEQKDIDHLYAALGQGDITSGQIAAALNQPLERQKPNVKKRLRKKELVTDEDTESISICGVGSLMTAMAHCCNPLYPDPVIGFITRSRGVTIHQQECPNALHLIETEPERVVEVNWSCDHKVQNTVPITIKAYDRSGLLRDITDLFSRESANIDAIHTSTDKDKHLATIRVNIELDDVVRVGKILDQLLRMRNIISAVRDR